MKKKKSSNFRTALIAFCLFMIIGAVISACTPRSTPEDGEGALKEAADQTVGEQETVERTPLTVGPVTLGMSRDEVKSLLGEPDDVSNSGEAEIYKGVWMVSWWYRGDKQACLGFINTGDGWILNEVFLTEGSAWELDGLHAGEREEDAILDIPDAELTEENIPDDEQIRHYYTAIRGGTPLSFRTSGGAVDCVTVGPLIEDRWRLEDTPETPPLPWSFSSSDITVWSEGRAVELSGGDAKRIETIMGIEELREAEKSGSVPLIWLDFHNGTVVSLCGEDETGTVWQAGEGFSPDDGAIAGLTELKVWLFPEGTWDTVKEVLN